jgi:hypothetical protein
MFESGDRVRVLLQNSDKVIIERAKVWLIDGDYYLCILQEGTYVTVHKSRVFKEE